MGREGGDVRPEGRRAPVLVMIGKSMHGQQTWRGAASRADLRARLPDRPFLPISLPHSSHPEAVHVIRFYADADGLAWEASSAAALAPGATAPAGPVRFRHDGSRFAVSLRQEQGVPRRHDIELGAISPGEGVAVDVNWRMPASSLGGDMLYVDTVTCALWPTDGWEMRRPSEVAPELNIRSIDLRAVLH